MADSYVPMINGKNYDWGDIIFSLFGVPVVGITEIEYTETRESVNNYGAGQMPTSYGNKNFVYKGSITIYRDELNALIAAAPNRKVLTIPAFTIKVIFSGDGVPYTTDTLNNVRFTENPFTAKQNDSALMVKIPFIFAGLAQ